MSSTEMNSNNSIESPNLLISLHNFNFPNINDDLIKVSTLDDSLTFKEKLTANKYLQNMNAESNDVTDLLGSSLSNDEQTQEVSEENENLQQMNEKLKQQDIEFSSEIADCKAKLCGVMNDPAAANMELIELKKKYEIMEKENSDLKLRVKQLEAEVNQYADIKFKKDESDGKIAELKNKLKQKMEIIGKLKSEVNISSALNDSSTVSFEALNTFDNGLQESTSDCKDIEMLGSLSSSNEEPINGSILKTSHSTQNVQVELNKGVQTSEKVDKVLQVMFTALFPPDISMDGKEVSNSDIKMPALSMPCFLQQKILDVNSDIDIVENSVEKEINRISVTDPTYCRMMKSKDIDKQSVLSPKQRTIVIETNIGSELIKPSCENISFQEKLDNVSSIGLKDKNKQEDSILGKKSFANSLPQFENSVPSVTENLLEELFLSEDSLDASSISYKSNQQVMIENKSSIEIETSTIVPFGDQMKNLDVENLDGVESSFVSGDYKCTIDELRPHISTHGECSVTVLPCPVTPTSHTEIENKCLKFDFQESAVQQFVDDEILSSIEIPPHSIKSQNFLFQPDACSYLKPCDTTLLIDRQSPANFKKVLKSSSSNSNSFISSTPIQTPDRNRTVNTSTDLQNKSLNTTKKLHDVTSKSDSKLECCEGTELNTNHHGELCTLSAKRCDNGTVKLNFNLSKSLTVTLNPSSYDVSCVFGPFENTSEHEPPSTCNEHLSTNLHNNSDTENGIEKQNLDVNPSPKRKKRKLSKKSTAKNYNDSSDVIRQMDNDACKRKKRKLSNKNTSDYSDSSDVIRQLDTDVCKRKKRKLSKKKTSAYNDSSDVIWQLDKNARGPLNPNGVLDNKSCNDSFHEVLGIKPPRNILSNKERMDRSIKSGLVLNPETVEDALKAIDDCENQLRINESSLSSPVSVINESDENMECNSPDVSNFHQEEQLVDIPEKIGVLKFPSLSSNISIEKSGMLDSSNIIPSDINSHRDSTSYSFNIPVINFDLELGEDFIGSDVHLNNHDSVADVKTGSDVHLSNHNSISDNGDTGTNVQSGNCDLLPDDVNAGSDMNFNPCNLVPDNDDTGSKSIQYETKAIDASMLFCPRPFENYISTSSIAFENKLSTSKVCEEYAESNKNFLTNTAATFTNVPLEEDDLILNKKDNGSKSIGNASLISDTSPLVVSCQVENDISDTPNSFEDILTKLCRQSVLLIKPNQTALDASTTDIHMDGHNLLFNIDDDTESKNTEDESQTDKLKQLEYEYQLEKCFSTKPSSFEDVLNQSSSSEITVSFTGTTTRSDSEPDEEDFFDSSARISKKKSEMVNNIFRFGFDLESPSLDFETNIDNTSSGNIKNAETVTDDCHVENKSIVAQSKPDCSSVENPKERKKHKKKINSSQNLKPLPKLRFNSTKNKDLAEVKHVTLKRQAYSARKILLHLIKNKYKRNISKVNISLDKSCLDNRRSNSKHLNKLSNCVSENNENVIDKYEELNSKDSEPCLDLNALVDFTLSEANNVSRFETVNTKESYVLLENCEVPPTNDPVSPEAKHNHSNSYVNEFQSCLEINEEKKKIELMQYHVSSEYLKNPSQCQDSTRNDENLVGNENKLYGSVKDDGETFSSNRILLTGDKEITISAESSKSDTKCNSDHKQTLNIDKSFEQQGDEVSEMERLKQCRKEVKLPQCSVALKLIKIPSENGDVSQNVEHLIAIENRMHGALENSIFSISKELESSCSEELSISLKGKHSTLHDTECLSVWEHASVIAKDSIKEQGAVPIRKSNRKLIKVQDEQVNEPSSINANENNSFDYKRNKKKKENVIYTNQTLTSEPGVTGACDKAKSKLSALSNKKYIISRDVQSDSNITHSEVAIVSQSNTFDTTCSQNIKTNSYTRCNKKIREEKKQSESETEISEQSSFSSNTNPIEDIFKDVQNVQFNDVDFKHKVNSLVSDLIKPANSPDKSTLLFHILNYLHLSKKNPLLSFTKSRNLAMLLPPDENCIVSALFQIESEAKPHLKGLLSTIVETIHQVVLSKRKFNIYGVASMCRVFTEISKRRKDTVEPLTLCSDLLKTKHAFSPFLVASVAGIWKELFQIGDNSSAEEDVFHSLIAYGAKKRSKSLGDCDWIASIRIIDEYFNARPMVDIGKSTNILINIIVKKCNNESWNNIYWLTSALTIFAVHSSWDWAKEHLLDEYVVPNLVKFGIETKNAKAFDLFCELYADISLVNPNPDPRDKVLIQFIKNETSIEGGSSIQDSAASALMKILSRKKIRLPQILTAWFKKNHQKPNVFSIKMFRRRLRSKNSTQLSIKDIL